MSMKKASSIIPLYHDRVYRDYQEECEAALTIEFQGIQGKTSTRSPTESTELSRIRSARVSDSTIST